MPLRVVFDTNVYISAIIFGGNPRVCLELARSGTIKLFSSRALLLELARILREKFAWSEAEVGEVIQGLAKFVTIVNPQKKVTTIKRDPADNRVLEAAKKVNADFIISGDKKHILPLKVFGKTKILAAADFLREF